MIDKTEIARIQAFNLPQLAWITDRRQNRPTKPQVMFLINDEGTDNINLPLVHPHDVSAYIIEVA